MHWNEQFEHKLTVTGLREWAKLQCHLLHRFLTDFCIAPGYLEAFWYQGKVESIFRLNWIQPQILGKADGSLDGSTNNSTIIFSYDVKCFILSTPRQFTCPSRSHPVGSCLYPLLDKNQLHSKCHLSKTFGFYSGQGPAGLGRGPC